MNYRSHRTQAFTLIELMISIGLGTLLIYTAFAGLRTASQTISTSNRLSLENSLLRAGYFEAQIQLDYWTNFDDPALPDEERPLKSTSGAGTSIGNIDNGRRLNGIKRGLPFTPMRELQSQMVWPKSTNLPRHTATKVINGARVNEIVPRDLSTGVLPPSANVKDSWEDDRGFDPSYSWAPHDPRTWNRTNLTEGLRVGVAQDLQVDKFDPVTGEYREWWPGSTVHADFPDTFPKVHNGRYILFSCTKENPGDIPNWIIRPNPNISGPLTKENLEDIEENRPVPVFYRGYDTGGIHTWFPNQMQSLIFAMGYAAVAEYVPANTMYAWHTTEEYQMSAGGWLNLYGLESGKELTSGNQRDARGIYRNTFMHAHGLINPRAPYQWRRFRAKKEDPPVGKELRRLFYRHYIVDSYKMKNEVGDDRNNNAIDMSEFLEHTGYPESLMEVYPENWPVVEVSVGRFVKSAHHVAVAKISRLSPHTGEVIELSFTGLGTTLRGARQQRHVEKGWAIWDNDPSVTNDPNLDTP